MSFFTNDKKNRENQSLSELRFVQYIIAAAIIGLIFLASIVMVVLIVFQPHVPPKTRNTSISLIIPNDYYITIYDDDNETILFRYNYTLYLVMMGGNEYENDIATEVHTQNFIDQRLLSYFLDIDPYNLTWFSSDFILNGKNLTLNFTGIENSTHFGVGACDFSMFNETTNYKSLDFGNTPFMNFTIGKQHNIYINGIDCYPVYENHWRPYLSYTIGNQTFHEKMAWNGTLYFP